MNKNNVSTDEVTLNAYLDGSAVQSIQQFCDNFPHLSSQTYPDALLGMGYQFESFDLIFAIIVCSIQNTVDYSDYVARYKTMQSVLQPFASEFAIEPERKLGNPHRKLYADFYQQATSETFPSHYPTITANPWLHCGRKWANKMISRLDRKRLDVMERARYNIGYHWSAEYLSIFEFNLLKDAWEKLVVLDTYVQTHCSVEEDHARCALSAIKHFTTLDDPLVRQGILDHEQDLAGFYDECTALILTTTV